MYQIDSFFKMMLSEKASDLHLASGNPPLFRVNGDMLQLDYPPLEHEPLLEMLRGITPDYKLRHFEQTGDVDFGYDLPGIARFRCNYFNQKRGIAAVFRLIPSKVLTFEDFENLGAPLPDVLKKFALMHRGLILVTGPTGSGKSTTLATIIDYANKNRTSHILTIEDPIEFVHQSQNCLVNHREVGLHTESFASALKGALREDPDIILVGELRDLETIELALTAASTGHLVFGTLHTQSAGKTIDRIIDVFPAQQQNKVRSTLAESVRGIVAQNLFKRIDRPGRVAAVEVLVCTNALTSLIREGKTNQIPSMMQIGKRLGSMPMDDAIMAHVQARRISPEEAFDKCLEKKKFLPFLSAEAQELAKMSGDLD